MSKRLAFLVCLIMMGLLSFALAAESDCPLKITEVMAINGVYDNGRADDWLEVTNTTGKALDIAGYMLSDDAQRPDLFTFPKGSRLKAGASVVVWCVGDSDNSAPKGRLNAPFKLSSDGEELLLHSPDGELLQKLSFPAQHGNLAWGLGKDGQYGYLETASPGKPNKGPALLGQWERPVFSTSPGFYDAAVTVSATAPAGADIRYTLDGAEPTARSPRLADGIAVKKTTVITLKAFGEGQVPSPPVSGSFFIKTAHPAPVVSLVTDKDFFFDKKIGALVAGSGNTKNYDKELEYPCHIEYFDVTGQPVLAQRGSFTASGHSARINAQKSIALYARNAFGPGRFYFNPFPHRDYQSYKSLLLRAANSDYRGTRLRDPAVSALAEGLDLLYQDALPIEVYLNGQYWGHYNLREKINKHFVAQWEQVPEGKKTDAIDILARTGTDDFVQNGDNADWLSLIDYCTQNDLNDPAHLAYVEERLDIDNFFKHTLFEMIIGNTDMTNVRMYRVPGGKWKYLLFDVEACFHSLDAPPINWYLKDIKEPRARFQHAHLAALLKVPSQRERFLTIAHDMIKNTFAYERIEASILGYKEAMTPLMPRHVARFKGLTMDKWHTNINAVLYYAKRRPQKVVDLLSRLMKLTATEKAILRGTGE